MTAKIDKPGIYPDFDEAAYFADPCPTPSLTQSICKILLERSPAHARLEHPRLAPPVSADDEEAEKYVVAQAIGNAAHAILLGRGRDIAEAPYSDWKTKEARAFRNLQAKERRLPILAKHLQRAEEMVKAARAQLDAAGHGKAFVGGKSEVMIAWQEGGLWFRSLIDWMGDTCTIYDFKTSGLSCAPHAVVERPSEAGWDIQAAMIERGLDVLDPDNAGRRKFHFINQENDPPYALVPVRISESDLTMGRKKIAMAIDIWARCIATNQWPCYPAETVLSRPKQWLETKFLEREVEHHERGSRTVSAIELLNAG
jgi:hypothetical protein